MFGRKLGWSCVLVALLFTLSAATAWARKCSLETVKGTYAVFEQGEVIVAVPPIFPLGPFVNVANPTFDGAGHIVSGEYTAVIGNGTVRTGQISGTYQVGSDCSYSDEFTVTVTIGGTVIPVTLHHNGFISQHIARGSLHLCRRWLSDLRNG
jgi:hypothetical protein